MRQPLDAAGYAASPMIAEPLHQAAKASVGTLAEVHTQNMETQIKALIVSALTDTIGEAQIPAFDLAAKYHELSALVEKSLIEKFGREIGDALHSAL